MLSRGLITVAIGIFTVIGGTAVFLTATKNAPLQAHEVAGQTTVVKVAGRTIPVELADTFEKRSQGLSDRSTLESGSGMLFVFEEVRPVSFWMRRMHFNIDIIWIRDGKIIGIERNVPVPLPGAFEGDLPTYDSIEAVSHVLEINAGEASGLNIGDIIEIANVKMI